MSNSFEEKASSDFSKGLRRKVRKALKTLEYRGITWHEMAPNDIRKQTIIPPLYLFYQMSRSRPTVGFSIKENAGDMHARIARMRVSDFDVELGLIEVHCGKPFEEHFRYYIEELINQCKQI